MDDAGDGAAPPPVSSDPNTASFSSPEVVASTAEARQGTSTLPEISPPDTIAHTTINCSLGSDEEEAHPPLCRICHDLWSPSEGLQLDCKCRGPLALVHTRCALIWFRSRGDSKCEVCDSDTRLVISRRERHRRGLPDIPSRDTRRDLSDSYSDSDDPAEAVEEEGQTRDGRERTRRWRDRHVTRSRSAHRRRGRGSAIVADASPPSARFRRAFRSLGDFCLGPLLPVDHAGRSIDPETGVPEAPPTAASPLDTLILAGAAFTAQYFLLKEAHPAVTPGLAGALAYMYVGAALLGLVQMIVALGVLRMTRWPQIWTLWTWAAGLAVISWLLFRRFVRPGAGAIGADGVSEGALVASIVSSVVAATSPTVALWATTLCRS